jgi:hypothetical protein
MGEVSGILVHMAKSDSFFIRGQVNVGHAGTYTQAEIDLGSFVNLGVKSSTLLRIHEVMVQYTGASGAFPEISGDTAGDIAYQLTTQSQGSMVGLNDKSVIAVGQVCARNPDSAQNVPSQVWETDISPKDFVNGYLVGVDTLYLAGFCDAAFQTDMLINVMLECTLEKATQSSATALALSQQ